MLSEIQKNSTLNRGGKKSPPLKKKRAASRRIVFKTMSIVFFSLSWGYNFMNAVGHLYESPVGGHILQIEQKPALILLLDCCSVHTTRFVLIARNEDTFSWLRIVYIPAKCT